MPRRHSLVRHQAAKNNKIFRNTTDLIATRRANQRQKRKGKTRQPKRARRRTKKRRTKQRRTRKTAQRRTRKTAQRRTRTKKRNTKQKVNIKQREEAASKRKMGVANRVVHQTKTKKIRRTFLDVLQRISRSI